MKRPEITYDALRNSGNPNQRYDLFKRVLCVCSGGLLRSPTTALVLAMEPFNCNTRSAGIDFHHALTVVDDVLMAWADEIVVMDDYMKQQIEARWPGHGTPVLVLNIPDRFQYRNPELVGLIRTKYPAALKALEENPEGEATEPKGEIIAEREQQGPQAADVVEVAPGVTLRPLTDEEKANLDF